MSSWDDSGRVVSIIELLFSKWTFLPLLYQTHYVTNLSPAPVFNDGKGGVGCTCTLGYSPAPVFCDGKGGGFTLCYPPGPVFCDGKGGGGCTLCYSPGPVFCDGKGGGCTLCY